MKKSMIKLVAVLTVWLVVLLIVGSCQENSGTTDLTLWQPNSPGVRQLVIGVVNSNTKDSVSGFNVSIKTPTQQIEAAVAGKKYVVSDLVAGTYTISVTLTGYLSSSKNITVVLPNDPITNLIINETILVTKLAPAVTITASSGGTVSVKTNSEDITSSVSVNVTVPAGIVFTMPDGSKPPTVSLVVTNLPAAKNSQTVETVGGLAQMNMKPIVLVNDQIPLVSLNFQPEGLTFDKPLIVDMNISDLYPATMPAEYRKIRQDGLSLNYVRKDGTIEKIAPDHFSADRNTVYFKIYHFSNYSMVDDNVCLKLIKTSTSELTQSSDCGKPMTFSFDYESRYVCNDPCNCQDTYIPWMLTTKQADAVFLSSVKFNLPAVPGYSMEVTCQILIEIWQLTTTGINGFSSTVIIPQNSTMTTIRLNMCHNQGGGS